MSIVYFILRFIRGIIGVYIVLALVGTLSAVTWLDNLENVDSKMVTMLIVKLVFAALLVGVFFGLRWLVNWLHTRKHGTPHPALIGKWRL